jgi:hypothetical protein
LVATLNTASDALPFNSVTYRVNPTNSAMIEYSQKSPSGAASTFTDRKLIAESSVADLNGRSAQDIHNAYTRWRNPGGGGLNDVARENAANGIGSRDQRDPFRFVPPPPPI